MHRLLETEDALKQGAHLSIGHLHLQRLVPILQQMRELAARQLQTLVQWHAADSLPLPRSIDLPLKLKATEHALIGPAMGLSESSHLLSIGQPNPRTLVTITVEPKKCLQEAAQSPSST